MSGGRVGEVKRFADVPGIRFEIARREYWAGPLLDFLLDHFRVEEPITRSQFAETTREAAHEFYMDLMSAGLEGPHSYLAVDESNGRLVGCRLNQIVEVKPGKTEERSPDYGYDSTNKVARFVDDLSAGLYALVPDSRRMLKFIVVGVHPEYMRRGIGMRLLELSIELGRREGCDCVSTTATALRSQRLFHRLGFATLRELEYAEYRDAGGERVFQSLHDGATAGKLMLLRL